MSLPRRHHSVTSILFLAFTVGSCTSSTRDERRDLERITKKILEVESFLYPKHDNYSREEFQVRGRFERSRALGNAISEFLVVPHALNREFTLLLEHWKNVLSEIEELHKRMIDTKRFEYNKTETDVVNKLLTEDSFVSSRFIDMIEQF